MRFDSITLHGLGPFTEGVTVDLRSLPGPLVAVTGENGAGKSVLLESMPGALYRRTPTRGTLGDLATARDAFAEVQVQNGASYRVRQTVDAVSGKGEALVLDGETGEPLVESGKRRDADHWVAEHLPPAEVLYSSLFAPQGSGGFLDLDPAPRKAVLMRVLGHQRLEELSRAAGERARAMEETVRTTSERLADEVARGGDAKALAKELKSAEHVLSVARKAVAEEDERLAKLRDEQRAYEVKLEKHRAAQAERDKLFAKLLAAGDTAARCEQDLAKFSKLLDGADKVREAARDLPRLEAELAHSKEALARLTNEQNMALAASKEAQTTQTNVGAVEHAAEQRVAGLEDRLEQISEFEEGAAKLHEIAERQTAWALQLSRERNELSRLEELRLHSAEQRIDGLRKGLADIAAGHSDPAGHASGVLSEDDALARDAAEAPKHIEAQRELLRHAESEASAADKRLTAAERAAEIVAELPELREQLTEAQRSLDTTREAVQGAIKRAKGVREDCAMLHDEVEGAQKDVAKKTRSIEATRAIAADAERIEQAQEQQARLTADLATATAERESVQAELDAVPDRGDMPPFDEYELHQAEHDQQDAQQGMQRATATVATATERLERAKASAKRQKELRRDLGELTEAAGDWRLLHRDLGRDGVQALELDAAGPELTELANDLLHTCLGPRFSVRLETVRQKASGKGEREGCWVTVLDSTSGREGDAKTFSGGERVLIGEAVSLAIAMLGVRHAGFTEPTLVRDETGAALDAEKGRHYIAMLRRAAELVGAAHVLFVTHDTALHELADARIVVAGGKVEVRL